MSSDESRPSVLLIDDDEMVLRAFAAVLRTRCRVVTAASAEAAFEILAADRSFRLILCDVNMAGADGIDIYERAVSLDPDLGPRFVFASGGPPNSERMRTFFDDPTHTLMRKPFRAETLLDLVL